MRILLLIESSGDRRVLIDWLSSHYEVVLPSPEDPLGQRFDLGIVDARALSRLWQGIQARKQVEEPLYLPFVLVSARRDIGLSTRQLWQIVDEIIVPPIERVELQARIEILLRARRQSLELAYRAQERGRLLEAERRAREQAEAALRLRDEFLSVAAHELKTPLTNLRGHAELTMKRIAEGRIQDVRQVHEALQVIDRQVDRLSNLVQQLLDISRIEAGELALDLRPTDLVPLTRSVVQAMQAGATRHTLLLQAPEELPAFVDPQRLQEVLYNLLDNAIRYSPQGGPVEVDLSPIDSHAVRIAVRDHGIGVPPEQRQRLFTRFFQAAQRPAGGLGLGLYVSLRIVELHGGRIWAEFPEDGGSRFVVELPRRPAEAHPLGEGAR